MAAKSTKKDQRGPAVPASAPAAAAAAQAGARSPGSPDPNPRQPDNGVRRADDTHQLEPGKMLQAEFVRTLHCATVRQGVRPEHLLKPEFWAHHASSLTPWAKIEVRAEDGSWYGEYIVLDCSRTWAKVQAIFAPIWLTSPDVSQSQAESQSSELEISKRAKEFTVEFTPATKWRVIRKVDKVVVDQGRPHRDDAEKWLRALVMHEMGKGPHPSEVVPA